jgi:hypothetical protein
MDKAGVKSKTCTPWFRLLSHRISRHGGGRLGANNVTLDELADGFICDCKTNGRRSIRNADLRVRLHLGPVPSGKASRDTTARPWTPERGFTDNGKTR